MATKPARPDSIVVPMPLLAGLVLVGLPLYAYLSPIVLWYVFALTVWSALAIIGKVPIPGGSIRLLLAMVIVGALYVSYGAVFGLIPGTSMVLLLAYLKLFEIKTRRDITVIIFLGYFLASSLFFHSQSVWVALYVIVLAIYFTSLLVMVADRNASTSLLQRLKIALRMVLQSLPLMLIMFVLFPRIPGPLWQLPKDAQSASTGLSEEMTPGNINKLVASYDVAFRVKFDTPPPENRFLYWRGLVLSDYDGKTWRRDNAPDWTRPEIEIKNPGSDGIRYRVTLEPHQHNWLYALEMVTGFDDHYRLTRELQLLSNNLVGSVISYRAQASLHASNHGLYPPERRKNLELPAGYNPKTLALAQTMRRTAAGDPRAIVQAALQYFSNQEFYYTLTPPLLGNNAMDDFLFKSRRGFCEHYASAFTTLMRAAGVPTRIVLGYQGGEINPVDEYMIVRQSDAHAWTEVWLDDQGWMRVDPTAAVAPQRIERGIQSAGLEKQYLPGLLQVNSDVLNRVRFVWDSFQNGWNQWVIGFDEQKQLKLFKMLGMDGVSKSDLVLYLVAAMSCAGLLVAWWVIGSGYYQPKDRVRLYYRRFTAKLGKRGLAIHEQDTPKEVLVKIQKSLPASVVQASQIIHQYQAMIYGQIRNRETEKSFVRLVRSFRT